MGVLVSLGCNNEIPQKSKVMVQAGGSVCVLVCLLSLNVCVERGVFLPLLNSHQSYGIRTSLYALINLNYIIKALSPNIVIWGLMLQHMNLGGGGWGGHNSVHGTWFLAYGTFLILS